MRLALLLLAATGILIVASVVSFVLVRRSEAASRVARRRDGMVRQQQLPKEATISAPVSALVFPVTWIGSLFKRMLGMNPSRVERYRFSPWLAMPLAVGPAAIVWWLLHRLLGPVALPASALCWLLCVRGVYQSDDAKRDAALLKQFPDVLATIVRAVRVGIPVAEALRIVAQDARQPSAAEFGRVHDYVSIGKPLDEALLELSIRNRLPEYRFFATALTLQSQTGGSLTETLESLADVIRKRVALKARGYALAAEARTSAMVLASLPVLSFVALLVLNPLYIKPFFQEGTGQNVFAFGVIWLVLGLWIMKKTIRKSLS